MHFLERGPPVAEERERAQAAVRHVEWRKSSRESPRPPGHEQGSCERDGEAQLGERTPAYRA